VAATVIIPPLDPCIASQNRDTDLVLENVRFEGTPGNPNQYHYYFEIRNTGPRCITSLSWKMIGRTFCCKACPSSKYDSSRGMFVLHSGEYKSFQGTLTNNKEIVACGFDIYNSNRFAAVKIIVDPNNDVQETNEGNNALPNNAPGCDAEGYVRLPLPH
jgi:hypothetical protein